MKGRGVAIACNIVLEVSRAIVECLRAEKVHEQAFTNKSRNVCKRNGITVDMEGFWQFPCCWVAVDGYHVPIKCPPRGNFTTSKIFIRWSWWRSLMPYKYGFILASCGFPGNSHDSVILQSTILCGNKQNKRTSFQNSKENWKKNTKCADIARFLSQKDAFCVGKSITTIYAFCSAHAKLAV